MGSGKMDIMWCRNEANSFITLSSELSLYKIRPLAPGESLRAGLHRISDQPEAAEVLAINSDLQYTKCVSCYNGRLGFPLVALGGANGRVALSSFKQMGIESPLAGVELTPRHARPCNCVAWNPSESHANLLAVGLDRHRNEAGLMIWDLTSKHQKLETSVNLMPNVDSGSSTMPLRPLAEYGTSEGVLSLSWFPRTPHRIAVGAQKAIKVYDLREPSKSSSLCSQTKAVHGVRVDSFNEHRLASFSENIISIWDTRTFERPLTTLTEPRNLVRIAWSPTRNGLLASLSKDSFTISLHDIQTSVVTDEPDLVVLHRNIGNIGSNGNYAQHLSAFAWHPVDENRLMTLTASGSLRDFVVFERMPVLLSPNFSIAWTTGKEVNYGKMEAWTQDHAPFVDMEALKQDISFKMFDRVQMGYGLNPDQRDGVMLRNARICDDNAPLANMWRRLQHFSLVHIEPDTPGINCVNSSTSGGKGKGGNRGDSSSSLSFSHGFKDSGLCGVKALLTSHESLTSDGLSVCSRSNTEMLVWKGLEQRSRWKVYRNKERLGALRLCGWETDRDSKAFDVFILNFISAGELERAAAIAVFNLNLKLAIEILQVADGSFLASAPQSKNEVAKLSFISDSAQAAHMIKNLKLNQSNNATDHKGDTIRFCIMALSGYTQEKSGLWRDLCSTLYPKLENPYLRAIFAFLTASADEKDEVLAHTGMKLCDQIAFACIFISDSKLHDYIDNLARTMIESGNLEGILLTGITEDGLTLLQNYVDRSGDVQTACMAVLAVNPGSTLCADERLQRWSETYRALLDQWSLWHQRAEFDVQRNLLDQSLTPPKKQVYIICNFCSKPVSGTSASSRTGRGSLGGVGITSSSTIANMKTCITSCPSCRKPLPRCALCQVNLGTALPVVTPSTFDTPGGVSSSSGEFRAWFTWCQSCRHGGHADHVAEWFRDHKECPVTQCECHCGSMDSVGPPAAVSNRTSP